MTIAADLNATLIALDRLRRVLAEDGLHHRAALLGCSMETIRDAAERARLIEEGPVPRHFLPQPGEAAAATHPGVVRSLRQARAVRAAGKAVVL